MTGPDAPGSATDADHRERAPPLAGGPTAHPYFHVIVVGFIGAVAVLALRIVFDQGNRPRGVTANGASRVGHSGGCGTVAKS